MRVDALQFVQPMRAAALERCWRRLEAWAIAPPPVEPLVLDFGLGDFDRVGLIEFWIANEVTAGYCGKYMFLTYNQACPLHSHRIKHETFFIVRGGLRVTLDGAPLELHEGQTLAIEPGRVHSFTGIGDTLMLELSTPCDVHDNEFEDPRIMRWLQAALKEEASA